MDSQKEIPQMSPDKTLDGLFSHVPLPTRMHALTHMNFEMKANSKHKYVLLTRKINFLFSQILYLLTRKLKFNEWTAFFSSGCGPPVFFNLID